MRILIIKMSSLGDIIHTLPALTDAEKEYPNIQVDWLVEEAFQAIPKLHPTVDRVIPVALRRWRKQKWQALRKGEISAFLRNLKSTSYDLIIDAQGLLKSAFLSSFAKGKTVGFGKHAAREPWARFFYDRQSAIAPQLHAIDKIRHLFSESLGYPMPQGEPLYGIAQEKFYTDQNFLSEIPYMVFLHGTSWSTKLWPEPYWIQLGNMIAEAGFQVKLLFGDGVEEARAKRIARNIPQAHVLPAMGFQDIGVVLSNAKGVVSVDTGLAHLSAALNTPTVSLYGPTDPRKTGTQGRNQKHIQTDFHCAPCFKRVCPLTSEKHLPPPCFVNIAPDEVWKQLQETCMGQS